VTLKTILVNEKELIRAARAKVTVFDIFLQFLIIGATSFGGVVPYLREGLITKNHWVDDKEFVELLSIRQSLPGLNATNMAVLLGDRLKGWLGAIAGIAGIRPVAVPARSGPASPALGFGGNDCMRGESFYNLPVGHRF